MTNNLKEIRKRRHISQKEMADAVHVTQGSASQWESGLTLPSTDTCILLADFLECSVDEILGRPAPVAPDAPQLTADEERILSLFRSLGPAGQDWLLNQADVAASVPAFREKNIPSPVSSERVG